MKEKLKLLPYVAFSFGTIPPPQGVDEFGNAITDDALTLFVSNILKTAIVLGGLWAVFNFVLAGYGYISAGGDPKKIAGATSKITMTFVGLAIATGAFLIAAIVSALIYGSPTAIFDIAFFGV